MSAVLSLATAALLAFTPVTMPAQEAGPDSVARIVERLPLTAANFSITNVQQEAALLLMDSTIILQMTDRGLDRLRKDVKKESTKEPNILKSLLTSVLAGSIVTMLDHGVEYSLRDLKEARVVEGKLVLESKSGERIFESVQINDNKVLETFSEKEARRFAKRVNEARKAL